MVETPANDSADDRLEELRQRWEEDRSSRVFLQLAEQLRQADRYEEAIAVLGVGLEHHPGWGAAQVALARCQLAVGQAEQAAVTLETVVRKDPTQMVAYRLLVDAYLELGDPSEAEDRLELYAELNPEAEDLEELQQRVRALSRNADDGPAQSPAAEEAPAVDETPVPDRPPVAPALPAETPPAEPAVSSAESAPSELGDSFDLPSAIDLDAEPDEGPSPPEAVHDGLQHLSGADDAGAALVAETRGPVSDALAGSEPLEPEPAASPDLPEPDLFAGAASSPPVFGVEPRPRPEPSLGALGSARSLRPLRSPAAPSDATAGTATALESEPPPTAAVSPEQQPEEPMAAEPTAGATHGEPAPTVTLGRIYLDQGHVDEARRIFEAVLEAEPGHEEARAALRALEGPAARSPETEVPDEAAAAAISEAAEERTSEPESEVRSVADEVAPSPTSAAPSRPDPDAPRAEVHPQSMPEPAPSGAVLEPEIVPPPPPPSPEAEASPSVDSPATPEAPTASGSERSGELDARTLLRETPIPAGLTDRKVAVLGGYLERIQSARTKDVP